MPPQPRTRTVPCDKCREKHLKCDGQVPCSNCKRASLNCVRAAKPFRVKKLIPSHNTFAFDPNQTWIQTSSPNQQPLHVQLYTATTSEAGLEQQQQQQQGSISFIDESENATARTARQAQKARDERSDTPLNAAAEVLQSFTRPIQLENENQFGSPYTLHPDASPSDNGEGPSHLSDAHTPSDILTPSSTSLYDNARNLSYSGSDDFHPGWQHAHLDPSADNGLAESQTSSPYNQLSTPGRSFASDSGSSFMPRQVPKVFSGTNPISLTMQEGCLVRCFVERLAISFDTSDRDHHYVNVVPLRAMHSPLLLYAICTAAARLLTQIWAFGDRKSVVEYNGTPLPDLNEESVIHYHNKCISYLMDVSANPALACSDDALTAITILRYHEQVDTRFTGLDSETFSAAIQAVFQTQQEQTLGIWRIVNQPPRSPDVFAPSMPSLRHSACGIAFRQEIWSVITHRRPFRLPTMMLDDYTNFDGDDFDWNNCVIEWCAHVVKFCFSEEGDASGATTSNSSGSSSSNNRSRAEQWSSFKAFEKFLDETPPHQLAPIYYEERNPGEGRYFPTIWLANQCQVMALQHMEIARIALAVHDAKFRQLGLGASAAHKALEERLRESTRRICGVAMCDPMFQAGMVTASAAISMCGEYFHDPGEQDAIVGLMLRLEREHAWPISNVLEALRQSWAEYRAYA